MPLRYKAVIVTLVLATLYLAAVPHWQLKLSAMIVIFTSTAYLVIKEEQERRWTRTVEHDYQELEKQTKLIVQSDFQLQQSHDELDKKLNAFYTLHALGQHLRVTGNLEQLFGLITPGLIGRLGFERCLIGLLDTAQTRVAWHVHLGFSASEVRPLLGKLTELNLWSLLAKETEPWIINKGQERNDVERRLLAFFSLGTGALAPLFVRGSLAGFMLLGNETSARKVAASDAELVAVMAQQLSVALENARLYEEVFQSRHDLEIKIQERTAELAAANAALQQMNKAKSDFVSIVAHELRTPLTSVKGYASILRSGQLGPMTDAQAERLAKIEKNADHLAALINNLLDIARIESGRVAMNLEPVPVEPLMNRLQDLLRPQFAEKQIQLDIQTNGVASLLADAGQIERVFINLLSNALKYTPPNGRVTLAFWTQPGEILVEVKDTGVGIAPENLAHLFEEFYRAPHPINDQVKGTGLGLSLTRRIVEAHHGTIGVESNVGRGTRVFFRLPATASAAQPPSTSAPS